MYQQIETQIKNKIKEQPHPTPCTITHTYNDGRVDITTTRYGELKYIETITEHSIGDKTVLLFLNNDINERIVI
ncbi:hypothetical protein [uncultured Methanobrevibacter sp.]|uniref:hypothetical protein n=1 Tax=uncultured Methanobrevibacter sp. TaxID=253161 RepID=UPI002600580A|nr:hypothetical protein [uncultured Methanobrevibacter sp.]